MLLLAIFSVNWVSEGRASEVMNPLFGYTHMQPSPFTIQGGKVAIGTDLTIGLTDFLQVGTNLIANYYETFNANAKVSLLDHPLYAAGLFLGWQTYNLRNVSTTNPDLRITSWQPGVTVGFALLERLALVSSVNMNITDQTLTTSGIETSALVRGAGLGSDLSWAYSPTRKAGRVGNVVAAGFTYDVTYKLIGFGISHHWPGFHFGLHYYPSADKYPVQPIIAGGTSFDL